MNAPLRKFKSDNQDTLTTSEISDHVLSRFILCKIDITWSIIVHTSLPVLLGSSLQLFFCSFLTMKPLILINFFVISRLVCQKRDIFTKPAIHLEVQTYSCLLHASCPIQERSNGDVSLDQTCQLIFNHRMRQKMNSDSNVLCNVI